MHQTLTGTLNVNHLEIQPFGRARIETAAAFNNSITNAGELDLGSVFYGNPLTAGAGGYTQATTGELLVLIGDLSGNVTGDNITVTGPVSLAGTLDLNLASEFAPIPYTGFDLITGGSLIGGFDEVTGAIDLGVKGGELRFVLVYEADRVRVELRQAGDATGRNFVGQDSLAAVLQNWGSTVRALSAIDGDLTGDGSVDQEDLDIVLANWGQSQSLLAATLIDEFGTEMASDLWPGISTIPEPATAMLMLAGLGVLASQRGRLWA